VNTFFHPARRKSAWVAPTPTRRTWALLAVALAFVSLLAACGEDEETVPDVVGKKAADAIETLSSAGFAVTEKAVFSDKEEGLVVSQSPAAGESEAEGATISIDISKGPETVTVPSLEGLSADDADAQLAQAGLTGTENTVPGSAPVGTVVAQDPAAGTTVNTGSAVNFNVSDGTETEQVTMPQLVGLSRSDAQAALDQVGLSYTVVVVP
jgi:beta-lactam-binding protein with PASTA domain